jgi:threonine dehydrogenase-like Zn-dependent dehydrogenase
MKAVAVHPGKSNSVHLREVEKPSLDSIPAGRGVLVKVLRLGLDGTDKEIIDGLYGNPPPGDDYLIFGHESFGLVEAVGSGVTELSAGDHVVATVRRPGRSAYDKVGMYDMTTDDEYHERGINLLHGFLTEYYVDEPEFIVKVPSGLKETGVLLEPTSVIEKGIHQAYEIQRRMRIWRPHRAAVLGAGPIGLLAAMALRIRGLEVCNFGPKPLRPSGRTSPLS